MKKFLLSLFFVVISFTVNAQIPYFAGTAGNGNLYGYTSVKFRPGVNVQETYTSFQYGIGNQFATGMDLYTSGQTAYWGLLVRWGMNVSPYFNIGAQITPSFDLSDSFKFGYLTSALYLNGQITKDGRLFWCSNTWYGVNNDSKNTITNWEFIGYTFRLPKDMSITPMVGCMHDWEFKENPDLSLGAYYSVGKWNFYLWGNDFFETHPRIVVGVDFKLSTR